MQYTTNHSQCIQEEPIMKNIPTAEDVIEEGKAKAKR